MTRDTRRHLGTIRGLSLALGLPLLLAGGAATAKTPLPKADKEGSADNALVKRVDGSFIVTYERKKLEELAFPLGKLEPAPGKKRDAHSRVVMAPKKAKTVEGAYTHLLYLLPPQSSSLEASRAYADAIKAKGGKILYECKEAACGGDPSRNVTSTSLGDQSLAMVLYPEERINEPYASPGYCGMRTDVAKVRYFVADLGGGAGTVSVLAYETPGSAGGNCDEFKGAAFASVDIVETSPGKP